jgi:hypothetical protein
MNVAFYCHSLMILTLQYSPEMNQPSLIVKKLRKNAAHYYSLSSPIKHKRSLYDYYTSSARLHLELLQLTNINPG